MIIKTLKFKNYRCFVDFNIEFDENIITFIGKNGVGKSCIFDGILYALYGFGQSSSRGGKSLIPNSTKPGETCEIELIFNLDGIDYKVIRRIKGKNFDVDAFLYRGDSPDAPIAERDSGVNKAIGKLLGMDYGTFKMSVYSAQKDLSVFTNLKPEERKVEIRKLLNLGVIKDAIKLAREDAKNYKVKIETWQSQLKNLDELLQKIAQLKKSNVLLEKELLSLQNEYEKIQKNLNKYKKDAEEKEKIRDKVVTIRSEINQNVALLKEVISQIEKHKENLISLEKKSEELATLSIHKEKYQKIVKELEIQNENKTKYEKKILLENELTKLRTEYSAFSKKTRDIETELSDYRNISKEKGKLYEQKVQQEQEQKKLNTEFTTLVTTIKNNNDELTKIKGKLTKLQELGPDSLCPECERELGDYLNMLVNKYLAEIEESTKEINKLNLEKIQISNTIIKCEERKKELILLETNYQNRSKKYTELQANLVNNTKSLTETTNKGKVISNQIKEFGEFTFKPDEYLEIKSKYEEEKKIWEKIIALHAEVKTIPTIKAELVELNEKIMILNQHNEKLAKEEKEINFDENAYQKLKEILVQYEKDERIKRELIHGIRVNQVTNNKDSQAVENDIKNQQDLRKSVDETKNKIVKLESLMVILEEFEGNLLIKVKPMIEEKASDLLRITTKSKFSTLELDQDYKPYLHDLGKKYDLERFSGGEQDLVNLCLRIAIADIVAQRSGGKRISFLVLDEIFGSQDSERRATIISTLQALIGNFRQIFLITHEDVKESMPIVYELTDTTPGNSTISLIH